VSTFLIDVTHTLIRELRFSRIFWIDATNDETIKFSYQMMAGYPEATASGVKDMASVIHWLSEMDSNWLLIFDNAGGKPSMALKYLPPGDRGNVLITSRDPGMKHSVSDGAWIEVEEMEEEDAISLLLKAASLDVTSEELRRASKPIVKELCFLPLAVYQAGATIASGLYDLNDHPQMHSTCRRILLAHPSFEGAVRFRFIQTVLQLQTWRTIPGSIQSESGRFLLYSSHKQALTTLLFSWNNLQVQNRNLSHIFYLTPKVALLEIGCSMTLESVGMFANNIFCYTDIA
jgi:hypothetical protein